MVHSRVIVSCLCRVLRNDTKTIEMAKHVVLSRQQLRSMELVRSEVGRCIGMASVYEVCVNTYGMVLLCLIDIAF